jgi:hypothetical protein
VEGHGTTAHFTTCGQVLGNANIRWLLCQCYINLSLLFLKVCLLTVLSEHFKLDTNQAFPVLYLIKICHLFITGYCYENQR